MENRHVSSRALSSPIALIRQADTVDEGVASDEKRFFAHLKNGLHREAREDARWGS